LVTVPTSVTPVALPPYRQRRDEWSPALSFQPTVIQSFAVIGPEVVVCEIELPVPTIGVACPSVAGAAIYLT
jgi:hypothetical protein